MGKSFEQWWANRPIEYPDTRRAASAAWAWQRDTIQQLRQQLAEAERERDAIMKSNMIAAEEIIQEELAKCERERNELAKDMLRLIETIKYLRGIAERGTGNECPPDATVEKFVTGYVKQIEEQLATVTAERDELVTALEKCSEQLTRLGYSANHADAALAKLYDKTGEGSK